MVVDDDDIRMALVDQLLAMGFEVIQATNGREALDMLSLRTIDGMLVDVQMPVMDGWTMLEQRHQRHSNIPIIVMSGGAPGKIAPKARE
jgi:CheY-like chemotaxis protein